MKARRRVRYRSAEWNLSKPERTEQARIIRTSSADIKQSCQITHQTPRNCSVETNNVENFCLLVFTSGERGLIAMISEEECCGPQTKAGENKDW